VIVGLGPGDQRVQEYVESEILHELDRDHLRFLGTIAMLERFSAELCDAVLERSDSRAVLEQLERSNLFVIPLDRTGTWFRLHHFFAALLRERHRPPDLETVYARAAAWHRHRGELPEAIRYLVAAGQPEQAAALMSVTYPLYVNRSRLGGTLRRWLSMLPPALVEHSPALCLMSAWVAGFNGGGPELERWLKQAERLPHEGPLPDGSASAAAQAALIRSVFCAGDLAAGRRFAHEAASLDVPESPWWPVSRALEGIWGFLTDGATDDVLAILEEAAPLAAAAGQDIVAATAYGDAAVLLLERGAARSAEVAADRCAELRERSGIGRLPQAAATWWTPSRVHLAVGRVEEARRQAEAGVELVRHIPPTGDSILLAPPCFIQLARVRLADCDLDGARAALGEARGRLALASEPGVIAAWLEDVETLVRDRALSQAHADHLTERELAVLGMLAGSATLRDIASELAVSHNTIKSHAKAIYAKLDVPGRTEAVRRAQQLGLIA
jgi:LuxR family maltose regulon positive regulatory protein